MEIDYQDVITLDDDNRYVVASKANYNGIDYVYLVNMNSPSNFKFMEVKAGGILSQLDLEKDKELLAILIPIFYSNGIKDIGIDE